VKESFPLPTDLIRAFAVVLVILLHASIESYGGVSLTYGQANWYWFITAAYDSMARPAVSLFVILTGALLLMPSKINEPIKVFLKKRFIRIGYAFAFWSIIYFAWSHFVHNQALTVNYVLQGIFLNGAYYNFWFLYLIAGLYLVTPLLRVVANFENGKALKYVIVLWFLGVAIVPLLQLATQITLNTNVFVIGGWIGYFLLGAYLPRLKLKTFTLLWLLAAGFSITLFGAWLMTFPLHSMGQYYFFYDSLSIGVIAASIALFILLCKFPKDWPGSHHPNANRLIKAISQNSLPIYLFQLIIMESLQLGFFGFQISLTTIDPMIEIPVLTGLTLFITLGLVLSMRKVPILNNLIG
jgi:surface polysaccharide O-acyltransferase-like enzyme